MEQIIITKKDGSEVPIQSRKTTTNITNAKQSIDLLSKDVVNITVESPSTQNYDIGDTITIFGRIYKLNRLPTAKKNGANNFVYELEFEGIQYDLLRATFDLTIETTNNELQDFQANSLTGSLSIFATVWLANANRVFPGEWALGSIPETDEDRTLTFSEEANCLSVLSDFCKEFDTEYKIQQIGGVNTLSFGKVGSTHANTFEYGKGKGIYQLTRQNVSSSNLVTRLKVFGSSRNITSKYRAHRLCLPGKTRSQSFIEDAVLIEKYGIFEATKNFDDIYPTRTGEVTALGGDVLTFTDNTMFDLNEKEADGITTKYLLPGVAAKIHFNSGNLAGYQFDVSEYDHATKTFILNKQTDDRGLEFPNETSQAFQFAVGDKYKLLDIALPQSYEDEAEAKLEDKGLEYYEQNSQPKVQYSLSIDPVVLEKQVGAGTITNIFMVGDYIKVKDSDIGVDKTIRVIGFVRNVLKPYEYALTISDSITESIVNRVISESIEVGKIITQNNLRDPARARQNWRSAQEVLNMVFDPEGDYFTDKIKPESIETIALSVGAKSMQFGLTNTVFQPNYNGNKNLINVQGGVLSHYTINENAVRSWNLSSGETVFTTENAYYIYAKCERVGSAGTIIFSPEQIKTESDANYYHFLIGVVNSVDPQLDVRSIALSYGFSMVNGRFIRTGRISSQDGKTYFDLDNNEIKGKITFLSSTGDEVEMGDYADSIKDAFEGAIKSVDVEYALGDTETTAPITGWDTKAPVWQKDKFMWSRMVTTPNIGDPIISNTTCIQGAKGKGIDRVVEQYHRSKTTTTPLPNATWQDTAFTPEPTWYIWTRSVVYYDDDPTVGFPTDAVMASGYDGKDGKDGLVDPETVAKIDRSAAITDKLATTIDGGLLSTIIIYLRDLDSSVETAGLSGIQGLLKDSPAFWAGGSHADALAVTSFLRKIANNETPDVGEYAALAKIAMLHSGGGKFGDFIVEESGRIIMVDPATAKRRLVFSIEDIPLIDSLVSGVLSTGTTTIGSGNTNTIQSLSGSANITQAGGSITIGAMELSVSGGGRNDHFGRSSFIEAKLTLYRGSTMVRTIWSSSVFFTGDNYYQDSETRSFNETTFAVSGKGVYTLKLEVERLGDISVATGASTSFSLSWDASLQGVKRQEYGRNGMMFFYSDNHFHYTENEGLDIRGKTNMPGVLASASVASGGGVSNGWGAKLSSNGATTITGGFRVPLKGLSHNSYTVQITPHTSTSSFRITTKTNTYFEVQGSGGFDYMVVGKNYE